MRSELSKKNPFWLPKERYLELKHFTKGYLYYYSQVKALQGLKSFSVIDLTREKRYSSGGIEQSILYWQGKIDLIDKTAREACGELGRYILEVIVESSSYDKINTRHNIPCGRRQFYQAYRKYFWLLDKKFKGNTQTQKT